MNKEKMNKIKCEICGKKFWRITNTHLWTKHQISMEEYQIKFPNSFIEDPAISKARQNNRREKTYEELFTTEEAVIQKRIRKTSATNQMQDKNQIKNRKEKCGYIHTPLQKQKASIQNTKHGGFNYRKKALEYYGEECMRCGSNDNLIVHHIDYMNDKSPYGNHNIENLMVLCNSCHAKLHNSQKKGKFIGIDMIEKGAITILKGLNREFNLDLTDVNLKDTPKRMARAYYEIFEGINAQDKIKELLSTAFPSNYSGMVVIDNIIAFSMCPHHFLPVEYRISVGYISKNKMLGLSKLPRLIELLAKQPILQEDFTERITTILMKELKAEGVMVIVHGKHMCMRMRGVKSPESTTITSSIKGVFDKHEVREEFMSLSKGISWN